MLNVTVVRSKWARGKNRPIAKGYDNYKSTSLLNDDGSMCCLGFVCKSAGLEDEKILGVRVVSGVLKTRLTKKEVDSLGLDLSGLVVQHIRYSDSYEDTSNHDKLTQVNDDEQLTEEEREKFVYVLGLEAGINFTFVD